MRELNHLSMLSGSKDGRVIPLRASLQRGLSDSLHFFLEGVAERFLFPDCGDSNRTDDLDCRVTLNSSHWRDLPFFFPSHNPLDLHDRAAMPAVESRIVWRGLPIQPTDFRPPCFIAQPGPLFPLQFSQLAHDPKGLRTPLHNSATVCAQQQIGKFQRVFDEPHVSIEGSNCRRRLPSSLFMTPIVRMV